MKDIDPWVLDAACASSELPPEAWDIGARNLINPQAVEICAHCPVRFECQEQAAADWKAGTPSVGVILAGRRWDSKQLCPECKLPSYGVGEYCSPGCAHTALCGTIQGYRWHSQHKETHCEACKQARHDGATVAKAVPKVKQLEAGQRLCAARDCDYVFTTTLSFKKFCTNQCKRREEKVSNRADLPDIKVCALTGCELSFAPVAKNHRFCSRTCQTLQNDRRRIKPLKTVDEVIVERFVEDQVPWRELNRLERREAVKVAAKRKVKLGSKYRTHRAESTQVARASS